jgi:twitching motility protein PilT
VALVDSLLSAIVRADGDALVMHVGERPYVVVGTQTINISTHGMNLEAMTGLLEQLLPADSSAQLEELGAVEYRIPPQGDDRFTVVAARGGDDIWIEIRRRRPQPVKAAEAPKAAEPPAVAAPAAPLVPVPEPEPAIETAPEPVYTMPAPAEEFQTAHIELLEPEEPMVAEAPIDWGFAPEPAASPAPLAVASAPAPQPQPAVVVPMTRTVRIEVPPHVTAAARSSTDIERLLRVAAARGATMLMLASEAPPWIRVEGDLRPLESEPPLSRADVERAIIEIVPASGHEPTGRGEAPEWLSDFGDLGRIRCTTFVDHRGPGVLLRMIATRAATAEQLGLTREVQALATESQGLVLVAAPRSGGKSTLISALVDFVNRHRSEFVITLERQIRLVHESKSALVSQREIRGGAEESMAAARAALRENPDVLIVDDLVSPHMVPLLLTAAAEGLLVFVSITAASTADAVQRFIELAPPETREAVQSAMGESFRGAVAQTLLKKAGGGLVAAREVLLATAPVLRVIADGQTSQLPLALESGRKHGMVSFTDALVDYVRSGTVDVREAFRKAPDRDRFLAELKRDGVDTSAVERLA